MVTFNLVKRGAVAALLSTALLSVSAQEVKLNPADYTTPTWTQLQRVMAGLQSGKLPYSINMTYNGDPSDGYEKPDDYTGASVTSSFLPFSPVAQ